MTDGGCAFSPSPEDHCWHVVQRTTGRFGPDMRGTETESCCWCSMSREWDLTTERDPGHGPHAPRVLVRKERQRG